jgi:hypothetical protein
LSSLIKSKSYQEIGYSVPIRSMLGTKILLNEKPFA